MENPKIEIFYSKRKVSGKTIHYCGIGDGVLDGIYGHGKTKGEAAIDFIDKYNKDKKFNFTDR